MPASVSFFGVSVELPAENVNVQLHPDGSVAFVCHNFSGVLVMSGGGGGSSTAKHAGGAVQNQDQNSKQDAHAPVVTKKRKAIFKSSNANKVTATSSEDSGTRAIAAPMSITPSLDAQTSGPDQAPRPDTGAAETPATAAANSKPTKQSKASAKNPMRGWSFQGKQEGKRSMLPHSSKAMILDGEDDIGSEYALNDNDTRALTVAAHGNANHSKRINAPAAAAAAIPVAKWKRVLPSTDLVQGTAAAHSPCARFGAAAAAIGDSVWLVGGEGDVGILDDLHMHDRTSGTWLKKQPIGGGGRTWHSLVGNATRLIAFGGEHLAAGGSARKQTAQVDVYEQMFDTWFTATTTGDAPSARSGHVACLLERGDTMLVFGGTQGATWFNDTYRLNLTTWEWTRCAPIAHGDTRQAAPIAPPASSYSSLTSFGDDKIVLFGGNDGDCCFNDVHVYNAVQDRWTKPKCSGALPARRTGHVAVRVGGDREQLYVFGGWDMPKIFANDAYVLDTRTWHWTRVPTRDVVMRGAPDSRVGASYISGSVSTLEPNSESADREGAAFVFGGLAGNAKYTTYASTAYSVQFLNPEQATEAVAEPCSAVNAQLVAQPAGSDFDAHRTTGSIEIDAL
ncbi:Acyl-CoA-binding domain-containing protein 4 [Porphyridium purpureum]|uniref:Acyl-CoA-binding domain-containing protein 4 n=1 Tax=Porphyridium purpureum TaxID=35688 RepID=A0A5J4YRM3_PORPP|nr:Acyl-CoA-binding domain-containing protein 4 [Porphyridium purpureum]|eukprot:POR9531..scf222_8